MVGLWWFVASLWSVGGAFSWWEKVTGFQDFIFGCVGLILEELL
jgi:hypothetical protein